MSDYLFTMAFKLPPKKNAIENLPPLIQANVYKALQDGMALAAKNTQEHYLTGPRPDRLDVVTGRLRSSVRWGVKMGGAPGIFATGVLEAGGLPYARVHEYGATIQHSGSMAQSPRKFMKFFWKKVGRIVYMRFTKRHKIPIPARPFIGPGMAESIPFIDRAIQEAIDRAYRES